MPAMQRQRTLFIINYPLLAAPIANKIIVVPSPKYRSLLKISPLIHSFIDSIINYNSLFPCNFALYTDEMKDEYFRSQNTSANWPCREILFAIHITSFQQRYLQTKITKAENVLVISQKP